MTNAKTKCGAEFVSSFVSSEGAESYACDREDGRHLSHRDADGTTFVRVPGGAIVTTPRT